MADVDNSSSSSSFSHCSSNSESEMVLECESEEEEVIEGVKPYMFEPEGSISIHSSDSDSEVEVELRTLTDDWCGCGGHCQRQDVKLSKRILHRLIIVISPFHNVLLIIQLF